MIGDDRATRWFGHPELIDGAGRCPVYLKRWEILRFRPLLAVMLASRRRRRLWRSFHSFKRGRAIYLHHFTGDDWSKDLHDHPKKFISIGLSGSYVEETPWGSETRRETFIAPWVRWFPAAHIHRLTVEKTCWTLVIVLKTERQWGFWHEFDFYPWDEYVRGRASGLADKMRSCA